MSEVKKSNDAPKKNKPKISMNTELSEEDKEIKEKFDMLVERLKDTSEEIQRAALEAIRNEVSTATSSMTSIPKPLKFLNPYYKQIKEYYETLRDSKFKQEVSDLISVLGITMSEDGSLDSLNYALKGT
jgi:26S proteasome regulatory subunit N1